MANLFAVAATTTWTTALSWATSSGGTANHAPPTVNDVAILDSHSPATITLGSSGNVCNSILCDGSGTGASGSFGGTLAFSTYTLTVGNTSGSASAYFSSGMNITGTGTLAFNANCAPTLKSAGFAGVSGNAFPGALSLNTTGTVTLAGANNFTVAGTVTKTSAGAINSTSSPAERLICNANVTISAAVTGSCPIQIWNGVINISTAYNGTGGIYINNTSGTLTMTALAIGGTNNPTLGLMSVSGTISKGFTNSGNMSLDSGGLAWPVAQTLGGYTITVNNNYWYNTGLLTTGNGTILNAGLGHSAIVCNGGLTAAYALTGSCPIYLANGTVNVSAAYNGTGGITINNASGTLTLTALDIGGTNNPTLTLQAVTTISGTFTVSAAMSLNGGGGSLAWPNAVSFPAFTITLKGGNNWVNTGLVTITGAAVVNETASEQLVLNGGLTATSYILSGSANVLLGGGTVNSSVIYNGTGGITINPSSSLTITSLLVGGSNNPVVSLGSNAATNIASGVISLGSNGSATLTSNGYNFGGGLTFSANSPTVTLIGNWVIAGLLTWSTTATLNQSASETLTCNGGITVGSGGTQAGTLWKYGMIIGGGTITWNSNASYNISGGTLTVNPSTELTITSLYFGGANNPTFVLSAGTAVTYCTAGSLITLATCSLTWNNNYVGKLTIASSATVTMNTDATVTGLFTTSATAISTINGHTLTLNGGWTSSGGYATNGSSNYILGGGTVSIWAYTGSGTIYLNAPGGLTLTINLNSATATLCYVAGCGTITLGGATYINAGTLAGPAIWTIGLSSSIASITAQTLPTAIADTFAVLT